MQKYLSQSDVQARLKAEVKRAGNAAVWAADNDFSKAFVSYVLNGQRKPSRRILEILGFKEITVYAKVEGADV
jgi:hypothetical protein